MKKLLLCCVVLLWLCVPSVSIGQQWFTNGVLTNPIANAILADTGPIVTTGASFCIRNITFSANVAMIAIVEVRDAANATTLNSQAVLVQANDTVYYPPFCVPLVASGQRVRVILNTGVTGTVQVSIQP